jgi:hypothetical protein
MAIRCCAGNDLGADHGVGARAVVRHKRLAELFREFFRHDTAQDVIGAAGGEWHDQPHRAAGVGAGTLCLRSAVRSPTRDEGGQVQSF